MAVRPIGHSPPRTKPARLGDEKFPCHVHCRWCGGWAYVDEPRDFLVWQKEHARCIPIPVRDALEAGWGQPGVHAGGLDPTDP